jgi:site-specific DNA-methyltransferase (adenine-specific)
MSATATIQDVLSGAARWCVVEGDCLQVLPTLPDKSVAHVITDPPYGINDAPLPTQGRTGKRAGAVNDWHPATDWDSSIDPRWVAEVCRLSDSVAWFGQWRKRLEVEQASTLPIRAEIVWAKDCHVGPPSPVAPRDERIWLFSAKGIEGQHFETSVWDEPIIPTWARREHKNEKPAHLMARLVGFLTADDAVVLDPFAGSGTTGVACLRLGRRAILIEKDPKYAQIARDRLTAESQGQSLREYRAGQIPMFGETP